MNAIAKLKKQGFKSIGPNKWRDSIGTIATITRSGKIKYKPNWNAWANYLNTGTLPKIRTPKLTYPGGNP